MIFMKFDYKPVKGILKRPTKSHFSDIRELRYTVGKSTENNEEMEFCSQADKDTHTQTDTYINRSVYNPSTISWTEIFKDRKRQI